MKIFIWKDYEAREYLVNTFNVESGYSYPLHSHENHWEFVYCEEGVFDHLINGKVYRQEEGEMVFIRESDTHSLKGRNFKYHNVAFSGAWIETLTTFLDNELLQKTVLAGSLPPRAIISLKERDILVKQIGGLLNEKRSPSQVLEFSHFLLSAFDALLPASEEDSLSEHNPLWFQELIRFINNREKGIPDLKDVIERSCKCPEHVSRSFRKYLKMTPSSYLKGVRLKKAAELLRSTNFSVKEVCYQSAYENSNYFHKQFRELYGATPAEYRRNHSRIIH